MSAERGVVSGTKDKSAVWNLHPAVTRVDFRAVCVMYIARLLFRQSKSFWGETLRDIAMCKITREAMPDTKDLLKRLSIG